MNHGSLFNGIGGFQLAAQWMGWNNIFSCEIDDWCNRVTKKHFLDCIQHGDITKTDFTIYRGRIDILTGGFPCQPFSVAGKRKGTEDDRFLWHEMLRAIREIQPAWIIAENVGGIITQGAGLVFEQVCAEMEKEGYEVQPFIIPACAKDAPHRRDRVWFVANSNNSTTSRQQRNSREVLPITESNGFNSSNSITANINGKHIKESFRGNKLEYESEESAPGRNFHDSAWDRNWIEVATEFCRVAHGIPNRVDRLKGLGNAIVPQVAYEIFKAIELMK